MNPLRSVTNTLDTFSQGNPALDMAIAMVIPAVITALFGFMNNSLKPTMLRFFKDMFGEEVRKWLRERCASNVALHLMRCFCS